MNIHFSSTPGEAEVTYHLVAGEGISEEELKRLYRGLHSSEELRVEILEIPRGEFRAVKLSDDRYYHIYRESEWTFELRHK
ncbi:MAG: hypothetical protein COW24_04020 [Candidatus Kerfeldbacteria bacterium CG15_BIG_FIL_POST_REV_8_21_14_020_45_12]|uniref:Uncharacterized protein n=1 Tax=Candidatus Kerfeldbacteria bacterium CG15_BIG_FIL_POST_REV_8_21_14_020_45_12 TaxID=2014247 RepID=A0A2M7H399_9BACT|nr:MAG: hypothetical protein COW24_04020 [Candidatus Kerfeldbacteria bacterium CG15_BIG_FIL_POST_REV_8_21_14_020_45_12]PJA93853.1 MAG: hypothetical protein CO132_01165 [Candidatus Kerfeldbacteria bacterium CG_4_9_14_3_um_filter_45_8]